MKSFVSILIIFLLTASTAVAADPTVTISPNKSKVAVGETVSVDIVLKNSPTSEGGGVTLRFKPSVVKVTGVTVNADQWSFVNSAGTVDNTKGEVSDILFSSFSGVSGDSTIATIQLQALKAGKTHLVLSESSINPFVSAGEKLPVILKRGVIKVSRHKVSRHKESRHKESRHKESKHHRE